MFKKKCKNEPRTCQAKLDCKSTAALKDEVMKELGEEDKPLDDIINKKPEQQD